MKTFSCRPRRCSARPAERPGRFMVIFLGGDADDDDDSDDDDFDANPTDNSKNDSNDHNNNDGTNEFDHDSKCGVLDEDGACCDD